MVEEHLNSYNSPFKFNAKELDEETGNYYYGARYYNPKWSIWLSVDPMAEKFPGWSSYNYTLQNPIKYVDPDGREVDVSALVKEGSKRSKWLLEELKTNLSDISGQTITVKKTSDGRYILEGEGSCGAKCTKANSYITHLLDSPETLEVKPTNSGSEAFPVNSTIFLDATQIKAVQVGLENKELNSQTLNVGFAFLHETLHTRLGLNFYENPC